MNVPTIVKAERGVECESCNGRFHQGQLVIVSEAMACAGYHLSCYAKLTREGTHEIGEPFRGQKTR